jgi:hypothetical protein
VTGTTLNNFVCLFSWVTCRYFCASYHRQIISPYCFRVFVPRSLMLPFSYRYHISYWSSLQKLIVTHLIKKLFSVFLDSLTLEYRADSLSQKSVTNYQLRLRNILVEKMSEEGKLTGLVTSCLALPSKTRYWMKYIRKDRSDVKTRDKTLSAIGWP